MELPLYITDHKVLKLIGTFSTNAKNTFFGQINVNLKYSVAEPNLYIFGSGSTFVPYFGSSSMQPYIATENCAITVVRYHSNGGRN